MFCPGHLHAMLCLIDPDVNHDPVTTCAFKAMLCLADANKCVSVVA